MAMLMAARPRPKPQMPGDVQQTLREPPPMPVDAVGMTPEQVARQRKVAAELAKNASDYSPVGHWTQGLGRVVDAFASNLEESRANKAEQAGRSGAADAWSKVMAETDPQKRTAAALALANNPWLAESAKAATGAMVANEFRPPTDDQREYKAAKAEGFPGSFMDYQTTLRMAGAGFQPGAAPGSYQPVPGGPADPSLKPPPAGVQTKEDEDIDAIGANTSMNMTIDDITKRIDDGKLKLGFFKNWWSAGENALGNSSPDSVEYSTFMQNMKKMQNDILILHNGVQTEGDAKRAIEQIITNPTDEKVVRANLAQLKTLNERALQLRRQKIDIRRERNKMAPFDPAALGLPGDVPPPAAPPQPGQFTPTDGGTLAPVAAPQGGAPQPGMIEDGMRFKGGNPADPNSWEPVAPAGGPEMMAPPGPQMAPPAAPDPYGLMDITRRREEMQRKPNHRMLLRGG